MANNPHAETYQGKTQFSGPIKAGSRWMPVPTYDRTTVPGTIAVTNLPNTGYVVMSQSCAVEQLTTSGTVTDIRLPMNSMLVSMQLIVTTAWTGTDKGYGVLIMVASPGSNMALSNQAGSDFGTVGVYDIVPTVGNATQAGIWKNINSNAGIPDNEALDIGGDSENAGDGRGILTINYIPGLNL